MTAKAALCRLLLEGKTLNIKNVFTLVGLTNAPREISRMIEAPFGVSVTRTQQEGKSRYGQPVNWIDYALHQTEQNKDGIEKMKEYLAQFGEVVTPAMPTKMIERPVKYKKGEKSAADHANTIIQIGNEKLTIKPMFDETKN